MKKPSGIARTDENQLSRPQGLLLKASARLQLAGADFYVYQTP